MIRNRTPRLLVVVLLLAVLASACGSDSKVGDKSLLNFKDQVNDQLGATTTTVSQSSTTVASKLGVNATTTTTAKAATTSTTIDKSFIITINGDKSGAASQFDPSQASVYVGAVVKWVNKDSVARSVVAQNGLFRSPPIPPGGNFVYQATKAGDYAYQDGTRPYANGFLRVVAR